MSQATTLPQAPPIAGARRLHMASALIWALIALGPLAMLLAGLLGAGGDLPRMAAQLIGLRWLILLAKSVALSATVSTLASLLAIALVRWVRAAPGRVLRRLAYLPLALLLVPPYLHATAWIGAAAAVETGLAAIGLQPPTLPGAVAVIWIELAAVFPVALGFTLASFRMTDPLQSDAARVFAPEGAAFRAVEWPQIRPAVLIGWALAFLLSLADFSVPSLMNIEVFALEAFVEYSIAADAVAALIVALPHLLIGIALIVLIAAPIRMIAVTPAQAPAALPSPGPVGWPLRLQGQIAMGFAALQVAVPVIALVAAALPFGNLETALSGAGAEIANSVATAGIAGALSVLLALVILPLLTTLPRLTLVLLPLAVPAALVGIGAIRLWTLPGADLFYNTAAMPVLTAVAQFSPVAMLALFVQAHRTDRSLIEAARIYRGDGIATWAAVLLPLWAPGLWAGFFAVFGLTLTELSATLLVSPPGRQALTVKIYSLLHYGASEQVAVLCLVMLLASVLTMAAIFLVLAPRRAQPRKDPA